MQKLRDGKLGGGEGVESERMREGCGQYSAFDHFGASDGMYWLCYCCTWRASGINFVIIIDWLIYFFIFIAFCGSCVVLLVKLLDRSWIKTWNFRILNLKLRDNLFILWKWGSVCKEILCVLLGNFICLKSTNSSFLLLITSYFKKLTFL